MCSSSSPTLPTELLRRIVILVLVQYLDDLIAGPHRFPILTVYNLDDSKDFDGWTPEVEEAELSDMALDLPNPVIALLSTSYQIRDVTLRSVSDILGISVKERANGVRCVDTRFSPVM